MVASTTINAMLVFGCVCTFFWFMLLCFFTGAEVAKKKIKQILFPCDSVDILVPDLRLSKRTKDRVWVRVYCSKLIDETDLANFWNRAGSFAVNNESHGITGFLLLNMDTREAFQMLEGEKSDVEKLYAKICDDSEHEIQGSNVFRARRTYYHWGMAPFKFHIPEASFDSSRLLWEQLKRMRDLKIEKPHWNNLFKEGFRGPYFVTTVNIDEKEKLQYHTRPFTFVTLLENANNTRILISILRQKDGKKKQTLKNLIKNPFVTISIPSDWANDHFYNYFSSKFPEYNSNRKMDAKHWFDTVLIRNDDMLVESGFHFTTVNVEGQDYVNVFPAERMFFCQAREYKSSAKGGVITSEQVYLDVKAVGIRELIKAEKEEMQGMRTIQVAAAATTAEQNNAGAGSSGTDRGFWDRQPKCAFYAKIKKQA